MRELARAGSMRTASNGIDAELLTARAGPARLLPARSTSRPTRAIRCSARSLQRRGGIARHDAVAWGYARGRRATRRRHHPELRGHRLPPRRRPRHRRGDDAAAPSAPARSAASPPAIPASSPSMAGLRLPIESHPLQALVSEPIKPVLHSVVMSSAVHVYVSQSDKGELVIGAGHRRLQFLRPARQLRRSSRTCCSALIELFPIFSRLRMLRHWGGIVDCRPDAPRSSARRRSRASTSTAAGAPAASRRRRAPAGSSPTRIAHGRPHPLAAPFALDRFTNGI